MRKEVVIDFQFEMVSLEEDSDFLIPELVEVNVFSNELTEDERLSITEALAQSDFGYEGLPNAVIGAFGGESTEWQIK